MFGSKDKIKFVRKTSVITRNQRSLYKLIAGLLKNNYLPMYARPAYHVFDVDEESNSSSQNKTGRAMVAHAHLDMIVVEEAGLKPVCAFRVDPNGNQSDPKLFSKETRDLITAAQSANFPLFIIPDDKQYSTARIHSLLKQAIPTESLMPVNSHTLSQDMKIRDEKLSKQAFDEAEKKDPWSQGQLR